MAGAGLLDTLTTASIACIGAAHIDRKAHAGGTVVLGSSNPVSMRTCHGGVARNVAENLAHLGCRPLLASRVGADADGEAVLAAAAAAGVDVSPSSRSTTRPTASYTALLNPAGELFVGMADMAIYGEIDRRVLEPVVPTLADKPVWFVDCNLATEALSFLIRAKPARAQLIVDAVSVAKAARLDGIMRGIDVLFCNLEEAAYLARLEIRAPLDICEAGYRLLAGGVGAAVITRGAAGGFLATPWSYDFLPAVAPERMGEVTGAGDALVAGFIFGRVNGRSSFDALRLGLACASLAIESPETVSPLISARTASERAGMLGLTA